MSETTGSEREQKLARVEEIIKQIEQDKAKGNKLYLVVDRDDQHSWTRYFYITDRTREEWKKEIGFDDTASKEIDLDSIVKSLASRKSPFASMPRSGWSYPYEWMQESEDLFSRPGEEWDDWNNDLFPEDKTMEQAPQENSRGYDKAIFSHWVF